MPRDDCERRRTDINVWEKRITLWFMAALVSIATAQVVEMNTSVKMIRKDIDANMKNDEGRDWKLDSLASEQNKLKLVQSGHEIRLETVEEKLKTSATAPKPKNPDLRFP